VRRNAWIAGIPASAAQASASSADWS